MSPRFNTLPSFSSPVLPTGGTRRRLRNPPTPIGSPAQPAPFLPQIPEGWDYFESAAKVQLLIIKWKNLTLEIANELYIAREKLGVKPGPKIIRDNCPELPTWAEYCESIGLEKRTANRWLANIFGLIRLPAPPLPKFESQVLYADPPWAFDNTGFDQSAAQHYPTLTVEEIRDYTDGNGKKVKNLTSEKRSVLFLWIPGALLPEGLEVIRGWGFQYKAQMIWVKDRSPGMGWWVNSKHEVLCIASKGEQLHPAIKYDSVFEAPVSDHSRKPELVYERIEIYGGKEWVKVYLKNGRTDWMPSFEDIYYILKKIGECEEGRFPQEDGYEGRRKLLKFLRDTLMTNFPFEALAETYQIPIRE